MSYEAIRKKIISGKYEPKTPLPKDHASDATKEAGKNRREEMRQKMDIFKADLEKAFGVEGNPKAEKLWAISWDFGHSAGYDEVLSYYSELVELIR